MRWVVVVPVKELRVAKTRLSDDRDLRMNLAVAMAVDVVVAARACPLVDDVVVVSNDLAAMALAAAGARIVADASDAGLNPALRDGARDARGWWPRHGVAAVASDLPCLTPDTLAAALTAAAEHDRALVADARGDGTTVLTAREGIDLDPRYGTHSRHAHVTAGAVEVEADPRVRRDVDTPEDLADAERLGVGLYTRGLLDSRR